MMIIFRISLSSFAVRNRFSPSKNFLAQLLTDSEKFILFLKLKNELLRKTEICLFLKVHVFKLDIFLNNSFFMN